MTPAQPGPSTPAIQLTRSGTVCRTPGAGLDSLRLDFDRDHCVRLPAFLEPGLLQFIQSEVDRAGFHEHVHDHLVPPARELVMNGNLAQGLLDLLLLNDPTLFDAVRVITACDPIGCFAGRVYRMIPGSGHGDAWHDDVGESRMAAISINLSRDVYAGGALQIRDRASGAIVHEVANTGPGDAILFRLSPGLEHRVGDVVGSVPKTAFAGWFCAEPAFDLMAHIRATTPTRGGG